MHTSAQPQSEAPLAAIDIGSNTIHLVVARPRGARNLDVLADETVLVRLGADVTATGAIGPERAAHALDTVRRQAATAHDHGAAAILGIATEGVRAARNGAAFLDRVREEAGIEFALVSGEQEAALTFWGATSGQPLTGPSAVVDLGGGSIELVVGDLEHVRWRVSLPLGSGSVHDRIAPSDPANAGELAQAAQLTRDALAGLAVPLPVGEAAASGGTATTLAYLVRRAFGSDPEPGAPGATEDPDALPTLGEARFEAALGLLQAHPAAEIARRFRVEEGRARLLAAGAVVLREAMRRLGVSSLRVSRRGIREGAILAYARYGDAWLDAAAG